MENGTDSCHPPGSGSLFSNRIFEGAIVSGPVQSRQVTSFFSDSRLPPAETLQVGGSKSTTGGKRCLCLCDRAHIVIALSRLPPPERSLPLKCATSLINVAIKSHPGFIFPISPRWPLLLLSY